MRRYWREKTVRRITRQRVPAERIGCWSQRPRARLRLPALQPVWPAGVPVYGLPDRWYAAARLIKFTPRPGGHPITALQHHRKGEGHRLAPHAVALRYPRYAHVLVTATDGPITPSVTRPHPGRLQDLAFALRLLDSPRPPRAPPAAYCGGTDLTLETPTILQMDARRGGGETDTVELKTRFGGGDFRVRAYAAGAKDVAGVHLAGAYGPWRLLREPSAPLQSPADLSRRHRDEHALDWLTGACQEALARGPVEPVLPRFLRLDA